MGTSHAFFSFPSLRCLPDYSRRQKLGSNNREFNKEVSFVSCERYEAYGAKVLADGTVKIAELSADCWFLTCHSVHGVAGAQPLNQRYSLPRSLILPDLGLRRRVITFVNFESSKFLHSSSRQISEQIRDWLTLTSWLWR